MSAENGIAREQQITHFLMAHGYADCERIDLGGDASTRRYERLLRNGTSFILMDAPPRLETPVCTPEMTPETRAALGYNAIARLSGCRLDAFIAVNEYLRQAGLAAPRLFACDVAQGLAILEDQGEGQYFSLLAAQPRAVDERELYEAAIDALVTLHDRSAPPAVLRAEAGGATAVWPLLAFDKTMVEGELAVFLDWYMQMQHGEALSGEPRAALFAAFGRAMQPLFAQQDVLTIRDYHSPNLMWRPQERGLARVGILDHQDALRGHRAYDLVSLLQDARRAVPPALEAAMLDRYLAASGYYDPHGLRAAYALWGVERATRIVGLWPRLKLRDNKPHYMAFMPHTQAYLRRNLRQAACEGLRPWFAQHAPECLDD